MRPCRRAGKDYQNVENDTHGMRATDNEDPLLTRARSASAQAYAPYSGVRVGAAVETGDGQVYTGCNVENASLGLTLCAERVALVAAIHAGHRSIARIAVVVAPGNDGRDIAPVPCGACLQFLAEFGAPQTPIVTATGPARVLADFLPHPFRLDR